MNINLYLFNIFNVFNIFNILQFNKMDNPDQNIDKLELDQLWRDINYDLDLGDYSDIFQYMINDISRVFNYFTKKST